MKPRRKRTTWPSLGDLNPRLRWLDLGLGVKRWLALVLLGAMLIGLGLAVIVLEVYRSAPDTWWLPALSWASLRFLPRWVRALVFGGLGVGVIMVGITELNRQLMRPFLRPGSSLVQTLREHRQRERGPRIVAIGGGHGLAALLRGLKQFTYNISAVVTVADDGGSSGRLRKAQGILPPGDLRNCLAALSQDEALLGQLFQYRFPSAAVLPGDGGAKNGGPQNSGAQNGSPPSGGAQNGSPPSGGAQNSGAQAFESAAGGQSGGSGLEGHSFGNLFITAMAEITGSFEEAVAESGRVLAVHGEVLPATLRDVTLVADVLLPHTHNEVRVAGESKIPELAGKVRRVWLEPSSPPAFPKVIQAILAADLIVIGPGSLYTSLLPNLLVPDLADAIRASRAYKVYVCNVATQPGETDGYSVGDHLRAIEAHVGGSLFDVALCNHRCEGALPAGVDWVTAEPDLDEDFVIHRTDLIDTLHPWRHDSSKLSQTIMDLFQEKTGPLVE